MISSPIAQILKLLAETQTQRVAQAELRLSQLAIQPQYSLLQNLITILGQPTIQHSIKLSCSTFLNSSISDNLYSKKDHEYVPIMSSILTDTNIDSQYKRIMERAIVNIIDQLQQPYITQFRQLTFTLMKQEQLRDTAYLLIGAYCVPDAVDIQHIVFLTKIFMQPTISRIILPQTTQSMYVVKEYNQILKTWIVAWDRISKSYYQFKKQTKRMKNNKNGNTINTVNKPSQQQIILLEQIVQSQQICQVIMQIYEYFAQSPIYISISVPQLNILKQQAAELHHRLLYFTHKKSMSQSKVFQVTAQIIGNLIINLSLIAANRKKMQNYQCQNFMIGVTKVVRQFLVCKPSWFSSDWKQIIKTIIFPLIKPNQQQQNMFETSPSQFVTLFQDCIQKQTYGTLKTQMCKFLQRISDKSEQISQQLYITDFIVNFCVDSIIYYFSPTSITVNAYDIDFIDLHTAFTSLSIFSYRLQKHKAKLNQLRLLFNKSMIAGISAYDRTFCYLFMSYNFGDVYQNPNDGSFWIELAIAENAHETSAHCAGDFLYNVADQYYSDYFVQQLTNLAINSSAHIMWDSLQKLIRTQMKKISPGLSLQVLGQIYQRLQYEIKKIMQKQGINQTLIIMKLIQIIKTYAEDQQYCKEHSNVKLELWKVFLIFQPAIKMQFQDDLFQILLSLLKLETSISQKQKNVLPIVFKQFARDQYYQVYFYKIINDYIIKLQTCPQLLNPIIKCINSGLMFHIMNFGQTVKKSQRRLILSNLLLLHQNILALHGKLLTQQQILQITCLAYRFVPNESQGQRVDSGVVLARSLNVMLMCGMFQKNENAWDYTNNYIEKGDVYNNYDIRVLAAIIKVQIFKQTNLAAGRHMILMLSNAIDRFRKKQKMDLKAQKIKAKYGKDNRLKLVKYKQYEQILKYIQTPFKSQKKLQLYLTQLLQSLKQANLQTYNKITSEFSKQQSQKICEICQIPQGNLIGLSKRQIVKVYKPKAPQLVEQEQRNNEKDQLEPDLNENTNNNDDQQQLQQSLKRKRIEAKKKKKNQQSNKQMKQ